MPENATEERRRLLRLYGAEIVESPAAEGSNGAVRVALELAEREPRYFMPFQYANQANPRAHYEGTGAEIAEALDRVDVLVAGLGTGGTLMGTGERLRESFPDIVVAAAEPLPGDPVMGLRSLEDGYVPPILDVSRLDRKLLVSNAESAAGARALLDREGIFAGVSAGAVVHVGAEVRRGGRSTALSSSASSPTPAGSTSPPTSGKPETRSPRWRAATGGSSTRRSAPGTRSSRRVGSSERGLRVRRSPRRRRRALPARRERRREPVPVRACACAIPAWSSTSRTTATSSPSSTRHPTDKAEPSRTDVENIGLWDGKPYLILSRPTGELRGWRIADGRVEELEIG